MIALVMFLSLLHVAVGGVPLICQSPVEAVVGDDVTLNCHLEANTNISSHTVDVKTNGDVVHAYRNGKDFLEDQAVQFRGRTHFVREDLSRGKVTLRISSVNESDSGTYKFFIPQLDARGYINLTVTRNKTEMFQSSTLPPPVSSSPSVAGHHDAAKTNTGWIVGGVLVAAAVVVVVVAVVGILVKKGVIRNCGGAEAATDGKKKVLPKVLLSLLIHKDVESGTSKLSASCKYSAPICDGFSEENI